jgi:hypothetical protein
MMLFVNKQESWVWSSKRVPGNPLKPSIILESEAHLRCSTLDNAICQVKLLEQG